MINEKRLEIANVEPMYFKQILLGNYRQSDRECLMDMYDPSLYKSQWEADWLRYARKAVEQLPVLIRESNPFCLSQIKNIIVPELDKKTGDLFHDKSKRVYVPFNNLWMEDFATDRNGADAHYFGLFLRNPFPASRSLFLSSISAAGNWVSKEDFQEISDPSSKLDVFVAVMGGCFQSQIMFPSYTVIFFGFNNKLLKRSLPTGGVTYILQCPVVDTPHYSSMRKEILGNAATDVQSYYNLCNFLSIKNIHTMREPFTLTHRQQRICPYAVKCGFHTLMVSKPGTASSGSGGHTGVTMPLHLCRGHVRTYSTERPLFGKFSGEFYIREHIRGSLKNGMVAKDYLLKK